MNLFPGKCYTLSVLRTHLYTTVRLAPCYQIVNMSSFLCLMEIDITLVLTNIYNNWPKIKRGSKTAHFGYAQCARTGPERLVGLVHKISVWS